MQFQIKLSNLLLVEFVVVKKCILYSIGTLIPHVQNSNLQNRNFQNKLSNIVLFVSYLSQIIALYLYFSYRVVYRIGSEYMK